jgi:hypothetical protein
MNIAIRAAATFVGLAAVAYAVTTVVGYVMVRFTMTVLTMACAA